MERPGACRESAVRALEKHNTSLHGADISVAIERITPGPRASMPDPSMAALAVRPVAGLPVMAHSIYAQVGCPAASEVGRLGERVTSCPKRFHPGEHMCKASLFSCQMAMQPAIHAA